MSDAPSMHVQTSVQSSYTNVRVWVTGATGFVGWHLSERLAGLRANVRAISRGRLSSTSPAGCTPETLDLGDLAALRQAYAAQRPEIVFHLAGLVDAGRGEDLIAPALQQNFTATVNLLLAAREFGVRRVVLVSSSEEPADLNEAPRSPYAAAKAAAGIYAKFFQSAYGLPLVTARPFFTYGPRQHATKLLPCVIRALLRGESPKLTQCRRVCDFVYVDDLAEALLETGVAPGLEGRRLDLGSGRGIVVREVVDEIARMIGGPGKPGYGEMPDRANEQPQVADAEGTRRFLSWTPRVPLQDGLARTLDWFRERR